jgi:hypothetical protein
MIERVIVCKVFMMSKIYFLANFVILKKENLNEINKMMHKFVWNNNMEIIKRNSIILPYDRGGLNMFNIECRIKTIYIQQFMYIACKIDSMFYFMSLYWMKFNLKELKLKNFNNIACGDEKERPEYYKKMIECVIIYKKNVDADFISNKKKSYK